jgi:PKD repeat protein
VTVTVTERFSFVTPFVNNLVSDLTLRGSATAAVLGLAATGGTNPGGCTAGPSSAAFNYTISGKTVTVDANASLPRTGMNAITGYNWEWGDGTDPYLQEGVVFSHTFANLQPYTVSLRVENPCGALQASQTIDLNPPPTPTPSPNPSGSPAPTPTPSPTPEPSPTPTPSPTAAPTATPGACTMRVDFTFTVNNNNGKVAFTGSSTGQPNPAEWHWSFGHDSATRTVTSGSTTEYDYPKPPKNGNDQYTVSLYGKTGTCQSPTVTKTVTLTGS